MIGYIVLPINYIEFDNLYIKIKKFNLLYFISEKKTY
jgi:hypothetical protein